MARAPRASRPTRRSGRWRRRCAADGDSIVIFHARGGSIARGGGRVDALVRAAPVEALNGVLRFTEQGEAIQQSYGLRPIAMRTLERAFNALSTSTLAAQRGKIAAGSRGASRSARATIADASRDAYRKLVHEDRSSTTTSARSRPST